MNITEKEILKNIDNILIKDLEITITEINKEVFDKFTNYFYIELNEQEQKNLIVLKHSIKLTNISFNLKDVIGFICENALALGMSIESLNPWKIVLLIVCDLLHFTTQSIVKLDDDMVEAVQLLDKLKASKGVSLDIFNSKFAHKTNINQTIKKLSELKIIEVNNNNIYLKEKVLIKNKLNV